MTAETGRSGQIAAFGGSRSPLLRRLNGPLTAAQSAKHGDPCDMSYDFRELSAAQREPPLRCPSCGHGLYTVDQVARLTGQSARTLQRRLAAAAIPGAIREAVPGGFRWLVPLEAVQGRVAEALPPLLEKLVPEFEAARAAEAIRLDAQRRHADREATIAAHDADEALLRAFQRSREPSDWLTELQGWVVDRDSAPLLTALQRTGLDFRRALHVRNAEERLRALDDLLRDLENAICVCSSYRPADAKP